MNNFTFYSPTEFVFGKDTELRTGKLCKEHGATKVMIVYGGGSVVKSGLLDRVMKSLESENISFITFGGIQPNPVDTNVYEGITLAKNENVDFLLSVGGGSVIDTVKAIAAGVPYDGDFWDFFALKSIPQKALKSGVVLTIAAAGSEGSGNSVITKVDGALKLSIRTDKLLRPVFAVMNPELTYTLPPFQTACGITDMIAHILERYFSNTVGVEISDRLAEGTLMAIIEEAPKVFKNPKDYDARANIMWSGMIAHNGTCGVGRAEDWASHFMEHEISAVYDVAHGAGLAVVFPAWLTWMADHHPFKVAQFAKRVWSVECKGDDKQIALEGIKCFKEFLASIGMPLNFTELGIPNPDIDLLVKKLHTNKGLTVGAYYSLSEKDTREIFETMK